MEFIPEMNGNCYQFHLIKLLKWNKAEGWTSVIVAVQQNKIIIIINGKAKKETDKKTITD